MATHSGIGTLLRTSFAIDLRTLALFRVALASLLLVDLASRWQHIRMLYTDEGLLPTEGLVEVYGPSLQWTSLHFHTGGSVALQSLMFAIAACAALALMFGYRTWLATLVSLVLLASLNRRLPHLAASGGDVIMQLMLIWSLFLPVGARWSVDSALNTLPRTPSDNFCSVASAGLLLQICYVYWFTVLLKLQPDWIDGSAFGHALRIDMYARPFGQWVARREVLHQTMSYVTLVGELLIPFLALSPVFNTWSRWLAILFMWGLHLGIALCFSIGLFPYVSLLCWVLFIPTTTWDALFRRLRTPSRVALRIYYDQGIALCERLLRMLRTFLLLPETPLLQQSGEPSREPTPESKPAWSVQTADGREHRGYVALCQLLRESPLVSYLGQLLSWRPVAWAGQTAYRALARSLHSTKVIDALLPRRPMRVQPHPVTSWLAGLLLAFITVYNVLGLDILNRRGIHVPAAMRLVAKTLRIHQEWAMFVTPNLLDGWYVMPAMLTNGEVVDIWSGGGPVDYAKPESPTLTFRDQRTKQFLVHYRTQPGSTAWVWFARWLTREWNASHDESQNINRLQVIFVGETEHDQGTFLKAMIEYDAQRDEQAQLSAQPFVSH